MAHAHRLIPVLVAFVVLVGTPRVLAQRVSPGGVFAPPALALDPDAAPHVEGTRIPGAGNWNVGAIVQLFERPLFVRFAEMGPSLRFSHQLWTNYVAQFGIGSRVALGIDLPVMVHQGVLIDPRNGDTCSDARHNCDTGTYLQTLGWTAPGAVSFGDLRLALRFSSRTLASSPPPTAGTSSAASTASDNVYAGQGPGWSVQLNVTAPTGDVRALAGTGAWTVHPVFIGDFRLLGMLVAGQIGYRAHLDPSWPGQSGSCPFYGIAPSDTGPTCLGPTPIRDALTWGFAGRLPAGFLGGFASPYGEIVGSIDMRNPVAPNTQPIEVGGGLQRVFGEFTATLGANFGVTDVPSLPRVRAHLIVQWAPRFIDEDHDGLRDNTGEDHCPGLPEDRDGYEDSDGCPEDNDDDEVPDAEDRCPRDNEDVDGFQDEDGCPDPDNDNDGVLDAQDRCRDTAMGANPDPERPGCPDNDLDGDHVVNTEDQCPDEVPGPNPDPARPGCPAPDRDHDRVPDATDRCPEQPAGPGATEAQHGCPDPDRDHDGVLDANDRCADQPETINGIDDDDGCAETPVPRNARIRVRIVGATATSPGTAELLEPVRFAPTNAIDIASQPVVAQLARAIIATARITGRHYLVTVRASGATDAARTAATARRDAVIASLRAAGAGEWAVRGGDVPATTAPAPRVDRGILLTVVDPTPARAAP